MKDKVKLVVVMVAASFLLATPAFADDAQAGPNTLGGVRLSAAIVAMLIGVAGSPVLTGYLTAARWPSWIKRLINTAINGGVSMLSIHQLSDGTAVISKPMLTLWLMTTITSWVGYRELKAAGITSSPGGKLADKGVK